MENIENKQENMKFCLQYGVVLEESASSLTQGRWCGKYSEGANLGWYP